MSKLIRPIAIYLPQFHPIPENDEWWGKGFTEWTNVVKAKPRFHGHYQPHLPADLGYYDLRLAETRKAQADLAKQYGIYGFCYYHYWFNGKRVLDRPFQEVFDSGQPDFPFMLCWANENWTRIWDGGENMVLLEQSYSMEDNLKHIKSLIPYFKDKRYIKIGHRPIFAIYKDSAIPNITETTRLFKEECAKEGIDLYLCRFDRCRGTLKVEPQEIGFDAAVEFQPLSSSFSDYSRLLNNKNKENRIYRYVTSIKKRIFPKKTVEDILIDYKDFVDFDINFAKPGYKIFPGVSPGWDNSSRRNNSRAQIFYNSSPKVFKKWVKAKFYNLNKLSDNENLLFINAWNEWAEGNHLEPCEKYGHQYLEALKEAILEEKDKLND